MDNDISVLQEVVGYQFNNVDLLEKALTHTSSVADRSKSNERLEFFGDAVLDLVICELLYEKYPEYDEGQLTQIKGLVVSRKICSDVCVPLEISKYVRVGKGAEKFGSLKGSIAAGVLEAIIAAIYLDGGYQNVRDFILRFFKPYVEQAACSRHQGNYKSFLQQYIQKETGEAPRYEIVDEQGPEHNKCFEAEALLNNKSLGSGWGMNKKDAEQQAAYTALVNMKLIDPEKETQSQAKKKAYIASQVEANKNSIKKKNKPKKISTTEESTTQPKPKPAIKKVAKKKTTATKKPEEAKPATATKKVKKATKKTAKKVTKKTTKSKG